MAARTNAIVMLLLMTRTRTVISIVVVVVIGCVWHFSFPGLPLLNNDLRLLIALTNLIIIIITSSSGLLSETPEFHNVASKF